MQHDSILSKKLLWVCLLLLVGGRVVSQPPVRQFGRADYQAGSKNWALSQGDSGMVYVGNDLGLLEYDGDQWQGYPLPNQRPVRAVLAVGERIYVGSYEEFGYWQRDAYGQLQYHSLTPLLGDFTFHNDEIWKILVVGDQVYFQSFGTVFRYHQGQMAVIVPPSPLLFLFVVGEELVGQVVGRGLYRLSREQFEPVPGTDALRSESVLAVLPLPDGWLIGTAMSGLFRYQGGVLSAWDCPASRWLKGRQLNNAAPLDSARWAFGTILDGVIGVDNTGQILWHLNKQNGLQDNTVLALLPDMEGNLWVGLNQGLDRLALRTPYTFYPDLAGSFGSVYTAALIEGFLYVGTNQGLYRRPWGELARQSGALAGFQLLSGSQGQVWELTQHGGQWLCGHNEGTFAVSGGQFSRLSAITGGWNTVPFSWKGENALLQGTYTYLTVYRKNAQGQWQFAHVIEGFNEPVRYVAVEPNGTIWASHAFKGIYKIRLDPTGTKTEEIRYYGQAEGFPSNFNIHLFRLGTSIVFSTGQGFFRHDPLTDRIQPYTELNEYLGRYATTHRIVDAQNGRYWFITRERLGLFQLQGEKLTLLEEHPTAHFGNEMVEEFENVVALQDSLYLICLNNGFALYERGKGKSGQDLVPQKLLLRNVETQEGKHSLHQSIQLPYPNNQITFRFAYPAYGPGSLQYQHQLVGLENEWSEPHPSGTVAYSRLPFGSYTLKIRVLDANGQVLAEREEAFSVATPLYASPWAVLLYVAIGTGLFLIVRAFYKRRHAQQQNALRIQLQRENEEKLREEAVKNERQMMELQNEKLQDEVRYKSIQLAGAAMATIKKNEALMQLREELVRRKRAKIKEEGELLGQLLKKIDESLSNEEDWQVFEANFDQAHEHFMRNLRERHPDLTPSDLRFCAYLRLNMSSKEIASLLNITVRGVEIRRYRLRRKLNISHDQNLVAYMMEI